MHDFICIQLLSRGLSSVQERERERERVHPKARLACDMVKGSKGKKANLYSRSVNLLYT